MYAQVIEEEIVQIVDEQSLRELYPSTHFPSPILQAHLEGFDNWYVVQDDLSIPEYDAKNKRIEFTREWNAGAVVGSYKVLNLTKAEKDALVESRWNEVKYHRNNTINATDYLVLPDVFASFSESDKAKIVSYRQALRDLTNQEDPFNISWPSLGIDSITVKYNVEI
jgi:hypothetical protein